MDLSPSEIRSQSFSRSLRGCNPQEVESFLEQTASRVESLLETQDTLKERIETLEEKLEEIGDATGKIRSAKSELSQRRSNVEREEEALARKRKSVSRQEEELQAQREAVLQIVSRLQGMMRREANNLQNLDDSPAPTSSQQAPADPTPDTGEREKSTQEWIDSLFPNRLGTGDASDAGTSQENPGSTESSDTASSKSKSRSQFEAIKKDVQDRNASNTSSSASSSSDDKDDEKPPTSELERIWDIFDES